MAECAIENEIRKEIHAGIHISNHTAHDAFTMSDWNEVMDDVDNEVRRHGGEEEDENNQGLTNGAYFFANGYRVVWQRRNHSPWRAVETSPSQFTDKEVENQCT